MFFYTSIFLASMMLALVVVWMYRAVVGAARVVWTAMLPNARDNLDAAPDAVPAPWGWKDSSKSNAEPIPHRSSPVAEVPWGWPGNAAKVRHHSTPVASGGDLDSYLRGQVAEQARVSKTAHAKTGTLNTTAPWGW